MQKSFKFIGLSYKQAPVEVRELLSLGESDVSELLQSVHETLNPSELFIISTCNRTEIYYASEKSLSKEIIALLAMNRGLEKSDSFFEYFDIKEDWQEATRQLFRVALGLEAQVIGDLQIINQIKRAYQQAADLDTIGPFLHRVLHTIFYTNKKVVQETAFRDGAASVSYATAEMVNTFSESFQEPKALLIGLGEIGTDVAKHLAEGNIELSVSNRSKERADFLVEDYGVKRIEFKEIKESLNNFDLIISSIPVKDFLKVEDFASDHKAIQFIFDLSMPRSVEPELNDLNGIHVYNIDEINNKTSKTVEKRLKSIPQVENIMDEALNDVFNWTQEMEVSPTIKKLKSALEDIRQEEIKKHLKNANPELEAFADKFSKSITQKIMKLPVLQLKAACKKGEAETLIDVLNDLFNLEEQKIEK